MTTRRSLLSLPAAAVLAGLAAAPVAAQSSVPASPAASVPVGPAITVVATEYHFGGLPTTVPVGTTLSLDNQGKELHELLVARKNDGVTKTWDELLQMPDDEAMQYVTILGAMPLIASPGQMAPGAITLDREGEYLMLCFIPKGLTEIPTDPAATLDPALASAPPHFTLGMIQTVTVTPAGTEVGPLPSAMPMDSPGASPAA